MKPELFMALLEEKTRKQRWQKATLKHKKLVLHPSGLGIKRLQGWLQLGVSGSSVNTERLTATCPLPAAVNRATANLGKALEGKNHRSCPGKVGNTGTPRQAVQGAREHRDVLGREGNSPQTQELFVEWALGRNSLMPCHLSR